MQPALQLEGQRGKARRERGAQLLRGNRGAAPACSPRSPRRVRADLGLLVLVVWFSRRRPQRLARLGFSRLGAGQARCGFAYALVVVRGALLRRRRLRHVPEPARRARGLGHRAGVSPCLRDDSASAARVCWLPCSRRRSGASGRARARRCARRCSMPPSRPRRRGARRSRPGRLTRSAPGASASSQTEPPTPPIPGWLDFVRWLAEGGRLLVWLAGSRSGGRPRAAGAGCGARRCRCGCGRAPAQPRAELDIRPESLPADIGAAVRSVARRRSPRRPVAAVPRRPVAARASFPVPIREASTEGDCVASRGALPPPRGAFFARLVDAWQLAVYGARPRARARPSPLRRFRPPTAARGGAGAHDRDDDAHRAGYLGGLAGPCRRAGWRDRSSGSKSRWLARPAVRRPTTSSRPRAGAQPGGRVSAEQPGRAAAARSRLLLSTRGWDMFPGREAARLGRSWRPPGAAGAFGATRRWVPIRSARALKVAAAGGPRTGARQRSPPAGAHRLRRAATSAPPLAGARLPLGARRSARGRRAALAVERGRGAPVRASPAAATSPPSPLALLTTACVADHALALAAALQLGGGDPVWFVDEETQRPSSGLAVAVPPALLLAPRRSALPWRGPRFGPLGRRPARERRSIREQVRHRRPHRRRRGPPARASCARSKRSATADRPASRRHFAGGAAGDRARDP